MLHNGRLLDLRHRKLEAVMAAAYGLRIKMNASKRWVVVCSVDRQPYVAEHSRLYKALRALYLELLDQELIEPVYKIGG